MIAQRAWIGHFQRVSVGRPVWRGMGQTQYQWITDIAAPIEVKL